MKALSLFLISGFISLCFAQTTDLAVSIETRDAGGANPVSQVHIYQQYEYIVTVSNTGGGVNDATVDIQLPPTINFLNVSSQNFLGGAAAPVNLAFAGGSITGTLPSMPNSSSLEIVISVRAPTNTLGGISITAEVLPPSGTTDTAPGTNFSTTSIFITDRNIDFQVDVTQVNPPAGTAINSWGDQVTYDVTVTNASPIRFPLEDFNIALAPGGGGTTVVDLVNAQCTGATGIVYCPAATVSTVSNVNLDLQVTLVDIDEVLDFDPGNSLTYRIVVRYDEGDCATPPVSDATASLVGSIEVDHQNLSPLSDNEQTTLDENQACVCLDLQALHDRTDPLAGQISDYSDIITYETQIINNGPIAGEGRLTLNNVSPQATVDIISATCIATTGSTNCSDVVINIVPDDRWITDALLLQPGDGFTIETKLRFVEPTDCIDQPGVYKGRTVGQAIRDPDDTDCDPFNNAENDSIDLLDALVCPPDDQDPNLRISKVQTSPAPPLGTTSADPGPWGEYTYEIEIENVSDTNTNTVWFTEIMNTASGTGSLRSVTCISSTNGASCPTFSTVNLNIPSSQGDVFYLIDQVDAMVLPPLSKVVIEQTIDWQPPCSETPFTFDVETDATILITPANETEPRTLSASSILVPCVDIVVQTFPQPASLVPDQNFTWVVDVTNSNVGTNATNVDFISQLDPAWEIVGSPTCTVTNGNATCPNTINVQGNDVSAVLPFIEKGATLRIEIPCRAPAFGGSFNNTATAEPDYNVTGENSPSSNTSVSSAFVLATGLSKTFEPEQIIEGETSRLTFVIQNTTGNPEQSGISFTDNLPAGLTLAAAPVWEEQNGATGTLTGSTGDIEVGAQNITIPSGVASISFSVLVTGNTLGVYENNFSNFSNLINVDASSVFARLEILPLVDLGIEKTVDTVNPDIDETITFTITVINNGSVPTVGAEIIDTLPDGFEYFSHSASEGTFNPQNNIWTIGNLDPGDSVQLQLQVRVLLGSDYTNVAEVVLDSSQVDLVPENNTDFATVVPECLSFYEGFSPNGDSVNDFFTIDCIELYPDNTLKVFNRYGSKVFEANEYSNDWDGTPNQGLLHDSGQLLPVGTYFYFLEVHSTGQLLSGHFYLSY